MNVLNHCQWLIVINSSLSYIHSMSIILCRWFNVIGSLSIILYTVNDSLSLIHCYWFIVIDSALKLIQCHWFIFTDSLSLIHCRWFIATDSFSLIQYHWFIVIKMQYKIQEYVCSSKESTYNFCIPTRKQGQVYKWKMHKLSPCGEL